jgi:hypothetical protein
MRWGRVESTTDIRRIAAQLIAARQPAGSVLPPPSPGVYAIFAAPDIILPLEDIAAERPLYVGMTESSLEVRDHFGRKTSGFSTIRRSLGALLRESLDLSAIPRAPGPSKTNAVNFRFAEDGESRLSDWMRQSLTWSFVATSTAPVRLEASLIAMLRPPLNLTGWPNPQRKYLTALRRACRDEAALARHEASQSFERPAGVPKRRAAM